MDAKEIAEGFKKINMMAVKAVGEGDYAKAIGIFREGLALEEKLGLTNQMAESYANIGNAHFFAEEFDEALSYLTKAQTLFQKAGKTEGVIASSLNISTIMELKGDDAGAQKQLDASLRIARTGEQRGTLLYRIACLQQKSERHFQAQEFFSRALMEFERINRPEDLIVCLLARAALFLQLNRQLPAERDIARAKSLAQGNEKLMDRFLSASSELGINCS